MFRIKSIYFKIILASYLLLTILSITLIGWSSLIIYEKSYKNMVNLNMREILDYNQQNLVETVLNVNEKINYSVFNQLYGSIPEVIGDDIAQTDYKRIMNVHNFITNIKLQNNYIINGIHIYYKDSDMIISSKYGLKILSNHFAEHVDLDWLDIMLKSDIKELWLPTREVNLTEAYDSEKEYNYSYLMTYPITQSSSYAKVYICVDFNAKYLESTLSKGTNGINYILDRNGEIISVSEKDKELIYTTITDFVGAKGYFNASIDGINYLISYSKEEKTGWILVNQYSIDQLYVALNGIKRTIVLIGIIVIITVGIGLSVFFAYRIYNPIKKIMLKIRNSYGSRFSGKSEFKVIDNLITDLDWQVHKLHEIMEQNKGLIISKLINDLNAKKISSINELKERTELLNINFNYNIYVLVNLEISIFTDLVVSHSESQLIKFNIIDKIKSMEDNNTSLLVADIDETSILLLACTNLTFSKLITNKLNKIAKVDQVLGANTSLRMLITEPVKSPFELHNKYSQLEVMKQNIFFLPDKKIITIKEQMLVNEKGALDGHSFDTFKKALYCRDIDKIVTTVNKLMEDIVVQNYALKIKKRAVLQLIDIVTKYMQQMNISQRDIMYIFNSSANIHIFKQRLIALITDMFSKVDSKINDYSNNIIERAKDYIREHIDADLSLAIVSEQVFITPSYLSTLFKEEAEINFSGFILMERINKAKELLEQTDNNIETIGRHVGYPTSHYFIKKFKEIIGLTPKQYREKYHILGKDQQS